jgi:hypothetical protein
MTTTCRRRSVAVALGIAALGVAVAAAELEPATVKAFDTYVAAAETRPASPFLWLDTLPAATRASHLERLRAGQVVIDRRRVRSHGREIDAPDGLIHHWIGSAFVPGATTAGAVRLLQDYDRHAKVYSPVVARSRLIATQGDTFKFSLRFVMTKVITVTVDGEHEARFASAGPGRARSWIHSTRLAEVADAGTAAEREEPVGSGGGYLWRINSYWRFEERDGGVFVECESISLTRDIPFGLGWIVGPFVTSLPRESLEFTLDTTRKTLVGQLGRGEHTGREEQLGQVSR